MSWRAALLTLLVMVEASHAAEPTPEQLDFVEKRIRPVLAEHCFSCHGPKKQSLGLRLDHRAAMLKGGDSGPVLIPGDPDRSLLIQAIRHQNDLQMPPKKKLTEKQIADLVEWVRLGAPWPESPVVAPTTPTKHWAFQPISNPPLPAVKRVDWVQNSIDRFILAALESKGLPPSAPADRAALLRRVTFDVTGLPPTPEEIDAFLNDPSPNAFERVVDRLLSSPTYGERWGRHWLDVARYADTKGYVFFQDGNFPWAYTYRDYVIRSLNDNIPFDRFILEQLAADLLPGADRRSLTALGFLTLGGRFMNNVHDILDDQIDVVTRGLMGLTVTCARCHDHKYDPISQKDYYALYGVFASCMEPEVPPLFEEPPPTPAYQAFRTEMATREKKLEDFIEAQYRQVIDGTKKRVAEYWLVVHAQGDQPPQDEFMLIADGNDLNPTMIKRWRAQLERAKRHHDPVLTAWLAIAALPKSEFADRARELCASWIKAPDAARPMNPMVVRHFSAHPPASLEEAAKRFGELLNDVDRVWRTARMLDPKLNALPDPALEQLRLVFHAPSATPSTPRALLNDLALFPDRPSQGKLQELRKAVEQWRISGTGAPPRAHALVDRPIPYEPRVFLRGNPNQPGVAVIRRAPELLSSVAPSQFQHGSGRFELARAIVDPRNPLTARVIVNRVWQQYFGRGLVTTASDFGVRSEAPSHPELLDHLATQFMRDGWSLKRLHRRLLLSATYQQRRDERPELAQIDPENRLLGRMNRKRLDFEAMRDAMLAVSGRLDRRIGGPSVKEIATPNATRRTMYGFIDRLQVPGIYRAFDFPSPDATASNRDQTTIPQQALFLMNSPFALECARNLLRRPDVSSCHDTKSRLERIYRICLGRRPTVEEMELVRRFVSDDSASSWERFVHGLMFTNEFVFPD